MNFVIAGAKKAEWTDQSIFFETFVPAKPEAVENRQFEGELARSGKRLVVEPDQSLMDVLNANSPGLPFSCTQGICGSCVTRVVAGIPDHRDAILTDAERAAGDKMCVCVGRAKSARLVLDL
jgi:vanillate O-demethylase ferredoxin subunit